VADGLVAPDPRAHEALLAQDLSERSYSPTGLQNFAACPYRFLLQAIHRLAPREEPEALEELDPLQRGSLVHEVLFELHKVLRERGMLPVTEATYERARAHLDQVLAEVVARNKDDLAPAIERVWEDGVASIGADLREWLRRATMEPSWTPVFFELSFGLKEKQGRDSGSLDADVALDAGVRVRGSIDLVERSADGGLRATDYKTGKVRAKPGTVIGGGQTLQPVFYALTLEKLRPGARVEGGRLYYCTALGEFTQVDVPLDETARRAARLVADTVHGAIVKGFLPAAPEKKACEYCDYRRVCGPYEEQRTARKRLEELEPLDKLRRHP
jgi:RecB family exonuclease